MMEQEHEFARRYQEVQARIRAASAGKGGVAPREVTLIAVSKTHPPEAIEALYRLGQRDFGENYAQEMVEKAQWMESKGYRDLRWHFIGHLQTNKVKAIIPWVHAVHSVDSHKLGLELAKRWNASGRQGTLPVFVEVNIDQEPSKSGVSAESVPELTRQLAELSELQVIGLMCIPSIPGGSSSITDLAASFQRLMVLEASCRPATHGQLSMGMTQDFEIAIQEGATHVRVGTALFGARQYG